MRKLFAVVVMAIALTGCGDDAIELPAVEIEGAAQSLNKDSATLKFIDEDTLACVGCGGNPAYSFVMDADTSGLGLILQDANVAVINYRANPKVATVLFKRTAPVQFVDVNLPEGSKFVSKVTEDNGVINLRVTDGNKDTYLKFKVTYK